MLDDYMNLPQFMEVDKIKQSSSKRLDNLHSKLHSLNHSLELNKCDDLLSLNEILSKDITEASK